MGQVALGAVGWLALMGTFIAVWSAKVESNIGLEAVALIVGLALTVAYLALWIVTRQAHTAALWWLMLSAQAAAFGVDVITIAAIPDPNRFVGVFTVIDMYLTHGILPVVIIVVLLLGRSRRWFRGAAELVPA